MFSLRTAVMADATSIEELIDRSVRGLSPAYSEAQIEGALGTAFGLDRTLIADGTYFVAEAGAVVVGCGGWSRRATRFGGDRQPGRRSELLDPVRDAARIRAFFVRPEWARRGIGRALLVRCEEEALAAGFGSAELVATLAGCELYAALGYAEREPIEHRLTDDLSIPFVAMRKQFSGRLG
jgi:GNAT superfamily N-acetyltransferase